MNNNTIDEKENQPSKNDKTLLDVNLTMYYETSVTLELPIQNWDDVSIWFVKWDTLHYTTDNKKWEEYPLDSLTGGTIDSKRPIHVEIFNPITKEKIDGYSSDDDIHEQQKKYSTCRK